MKRLLILAAALFASACFHKAYRQTSDCEDLSGEQRIACTACTVQNKAEGWLGVYEYKPDNNAGERCVRVK